MNALYELIQSAQTSSVMKIAAMRTLCSSLQHSNSMNHFLNAQMMELDSSSNSSDTTTNQQMNHNETGYQKILKTIADKEETVPNVRVIHMVKIVLQLVHTFQTFNNYRTHLESALNSVQTSSLDFVSVFDSLQVFLRLLCLQLETKLLQELRNVLKENITTQQSEEEDDEDEDDYIKATIRRPLKGPNAALAADIPSFFVSYLNSSNFLSLLVSLLKKISTTLTPKEQFQTLSISRHILLLLLSCRGGLQYLATSAEETINELVEFFHQNAAECKVDEGDLPSLAFCLESPDKCSSSHLAHLLIYHLQSLKEFDELIVATDSGNNNLKEFQFKVLIQTEKKILILKNLYNMTTTEIGKHAVVATLSQNDGISCILSLLDLSGSEAELKNSVTAQYGIPLLLLMFQSESNVGMLARIGPGIYDSVLRLESLPLASELKSRVQHILLLLKPSVILKDKQVLETLFNH